MPAINAPSSSQTVLDLTGALGRQVNFNPFSGPTGAPLGAYKPADPAVAPSIPPAFPPANVKDPDNYSVGALNTGIGFGCLLNIDPTAPASIKAAGFSDDYTPGVTLPDGTATTTAILTAIGGGKSTANVGGLAPTVPYEEQPLLNMGNGGSRNAGAGPIFTGFFSKMVTAIADIANGVAVEAGFLNRTGATILTGHSTDGSSNTASPVVQ